jgi:WD40 repeat protein
MASLFISYSRKDIDAARKLTEAFKSQDLDVWIDWEGIAPTVDWWREIEKGIEEADIFLFLISPDSAKSKVCTREIEHANKNAKRLIPIVVRDVAGDESPAGLGHLNWIFFRESDDFNKSLEILITAIRTDYEWVQAHRQLQVKALEWERNNHENSFLLHGKELQDADFQLATNTSKEPHPTDLQREYVLRSRQESDRRRRTNRVIAIAVMIGLAVLALYAFNQARLAERNAIEAKEQEAIAVTNAKEAQDQAALARARELAAIANTTLELDPDLSMHLAMQSLHEDYTLQGEEALRRALVSPPVQFTLEGHSGAVYRVEYDREGNRLVTASEDGTARIWDAVTGEELMQLLGHTGAVYAAAFSPNGQFVATAGDDGTVRIWDSKTGEQLNQLEEHSEAVGSVAFSADGRFIVSASNDHTARVWRVSNGAEVHILDAHTASVRSAVFSPNGELIATGGYDAAIYFWDTTTGELVSSVDTSPEVVNSLAFSADSQYIFFDWLYQAYRWDVPNGTAVSRYFGRHTWYVTGVTINPSDETQVVTTSRDHTTRIWDTRPGVSGTESSNEIAVLRGQGGTIYSAAFDPSGDHLATASEDHTVRIWNLAEWRKRVLIEDGGPFIEAVYNSDGSQIATVGSDGMVRIWDVATGREVHAWQYAGWRINHLQISPDDQMIITSDDDGVWRVWDAATGEPLHEAEPIGNILSDARFSPDGTRIMTTGRDGLATIWDAGTFEPLVQFKGHDAGLWKGKFSPDGQLAVTTSADRTARVWDLQTGEPLHILSGHKELVTSAAFSSDGKRIVTASVDGTARIWDAESGKMIYILKGHLSEVSDAAFSPDDQYVATASHDDTVILWNAATGEEFVRLFGHDWDLRTVAFSPDGKYLLTASIDGTARIYPVHYEDVLALAQSLLSPRELTCVERVKYLHDEPLCATSTPTLRFPP